MSATKKISNVSLSQKPSSHSWTAQIALADKADWHRFAIGDSFDIELGDVAYHLIVDNKQLQRSGVAKHAPVITAVSPVSLYGAPNATRITKTWVDPVAAKAACEEVLEQSIDWQIVDWIIEAGKLAFTDANPLDIARSIVNAAGGVLRSNPDGSLRAVKAYPVSVKDWQNAAVNHTLSDAADNVKIIEQQRPSEQVNSIYVSSESSDSSQMQMQVDRRADGLNSGAISFAPGETVGVLVFASPGVEVGTLKSSSGIVSVEADQAFQHTEDLAFSSTDSAALLYPAESIESVAWIGNDLGVLGLETDQQTVVISEPGIGICRVTYNVKAKAFKVTTEASINDLTDYPVQLHLEGESGTASSQRSIIGVRGDGDKPGDDISDPIITDIQALMARATSELDKGEGLQPVAIDCIFRTGLELGQLVQIEDTEQGAWKGMINGITIKYNGVTTLATLDTLRQE